jgi:hypothetical protein
MPHGTLFIKMHIIFKWKSWIGLNGSCGEFNLLDIEGALPMNYTANEFPTITEERFKGSDKSVCSWDSDVAI